MTSVVHINYANLALKKGNKRKTLEWNSRFKYCINNKYTKEFNKMVQKNTFKGEKCTKNIDYEKEKIRYNVYFIRLSCSDRTNENLLVSLKTQVNYV